MIKIIVLTFVYPSVMKYFGQFLGSMNQQSNKLFELYIVNDNVENLEEFITFQNINVKIRVIPISGGFSPSQIRTIGIQWAINASADCIIFADADDYFARNRVEVSAKLLESKDLIFNDLVAVGKGINIPKSLLTKRFKEGDAISFSDLENSNCLGLTNTAVKTKELHSVIEQTTKDVIAYDWYLFSLLLRKGLLAWFTQQTHTYYRQHDCNIASLTNFDDNSIVAGIKVKMLHYEANTIFGKMYEEKAVQFRNLYNQIEKDALLKSYYCSKVRQSIMDSPLWWENIITQEDLK